MSLNANCAETVRAVVVNQFVHDVGAFTQGLVWDEGWLIESTGRYGESTLRRVNLYSGKVEEIVDLDARFFGEGCAVVDDQVIVLTWREQSALVYDKHSFELLQSYSYDGEGWGLAYDGANLIMSDGTSTLYFRDPNTFDLLHTITVKDNGQPVVRLNELEWIEGELWANVWMNERIARIDPNDGQVIGWVDASGLLSPEEVTTRTDVLNGVAYDAMNGRIFITGKNWPKVFEIEMPSRQSNMAEWPWVK